MKLDFTLAKVVDSDKSDVRDIEHMYQLGETIFGIIGPRLVENGWSIFPQERDERRGPAKVDNVALKWGVYQTRLPTLEEVSSWSVQCPTHNVAIITGKSSNYIFGLDIDVNDVEFVSKIRDCAIRCLGDTPFKRVGRSPRVMLVYRTTDEDKVAKRAFKFSMPDDDDCPSEDGLEILSNGSPFTAYGRHHKTGKYFSWTSELQPMTSTSDDVPIVTSDQLDNFLKEIQEIRSFYRPTKSFSEVDYIYDEKNDAYVPSVKAKSGGRIVEGSDGLIIDGREEYLSKVVFLALANGYHDFKEKQVSDQDVERNLLPLIVNEFRSKAKMSGRWTDGYLKREAYQKLHRLLVHANEGLVTFKPKIKSDGSSKNFDMKSLTMPPPRIPLGEMDTLNFIHTHADKTKKSISDRVPLRMTLINDGASQNDIDQRRSNERDRGLIPDRRAISDSVYLGVKTGLDSFFNDVYKSDTVSSRIHVLKAPTGAGKTSHTIKYISLDERTKQWDTLKDGGGEAPGPILFLLPTYNNIEELRSRADVLNLDNSLSDEDLIDQARDCGIIKEEDVEIRIDDLRRDASNAGLKTMIYRGKLAAGCQIPDKLQLLMKAGIGTSGLCRATTKNKETDESEDKFCPHYSSCPAILQRKMIRESHVVFLPHAFLTLTIPEELQNVRGVVADERIFHMFVHTANLSRVTLKLPRKPPKLTKKEKDSGLNPDDLLMDRERISNFVSDIFLRSDRPCPAKILKNYKYEYYDNNSMKKVMTGIDLIRSAKRVCGNAITSGVEINPDMSLEDIKVLCDMPTGTEVREEWRFWQILEERVEALLLDDLNESLMKSAKANGSEEDFSFLKRKAKGDREYRIQFILVKGDNGNPKEMIRLSWRSKPNWGESPLLLLDASASPEIISKIFDDREVVVHDVDAPLNVRTVAVIDRTYANASMISSASDKSTSKVITARLKRNIQNLLSTISSLYGWGRVVCGSSVIVRKAINQAWKGPSNLDWCHFGAMRGLDFAKHHVAAVSIGRMEVPIQIIDGYAAALTYDDDEPELPYDVTGRASVDTANPLRLPLEEQVIKLRSGFDVSVSKPVFPSKWAKIIQKQYREEELSQFLGRLRPVYREGEAPVWFAVSKVIPEHVVVDDVVALDDLIARHGQRRNRSVLWDAVRVCNGIVHPDLLYVCNQMTYKSREFSEADMIRHGFGIDSHTCSLENRMTWGFTPFTMTMPNGDKSLGYIRTDIRNKEDLIYENFRDHLGLIVDDVKVGEPFRPHIVGGHRSPDWVDQQIGDTLKREMDENAVRSQVAVWAVTNFDEKSFKSGFGDHVSLPVLVSVNNNGDGSVGFKCDDLMAARSTEMMWENIKGAEVPLVSSLSSVDDNDYARLGDHIDDDYDSIDSADHVRDEDIPIDYDLDDLIDDELFDYE